MAPNAATLPRLLGLFIVAYVALLVAALLFFDASVPLDGRMLSPVYAAGLVIVLGAIGQARGRAGPGSAGRWVVAAACVALAAGIVYNGAAELVRIAADGQGYAARRWQASAVRDVVAAVPAGAPIYSNGPDAVRFLTGRAALWLPQKKDFFTHQVPPDLPGRMAAMADDLRARGGVLLFLHSPEQYFMSDEYQPSEAELAAALPLRLVRRFGEGAAYTVGPDR